MRISNRNTRRRSGGSPFKFKDDLRWLLVWVPGLLLGAFAVGGGLYIVYELMGIATESF